MSTDTAAVTLAGADLEAAREVAAFAALHPMGSSEGPEHVELRDLWHFAKVAQLLDALGERPGEPTHPEDASRPVELSPAHGNFLAGLGADMADMCDTAITSGMPKGTPPVSPAHATYYGAKVATAKRVLALLAERA